MPKLNKPPAFELFAGVPKGDAAEAAPLLAPNTLAEESDDGAGFPKAGVGVPNVVLDDEAAPKVGKAPEDPNAELALVVAGAVPKVAGATPPADGFAPNENIPPELFSPSFLAVSTPPLKLKTGFAAADSGAEVFPKENADPPVAEGATVLLVPEALL